MDASLYGAFVVSVFVLGIAPGPDNLFVLVQSATYGSRAGLWVVAGLLTGVVIQSICVAMGLAAVVAASPTIFLLIRLVGAAYLLYLAWGAWRAGAEGAARTMNTTDAVKLWRRGLVMNVTNPKVQIFFLAFFPQFVSRDAQGWQVVFELLVLGATFLVISLIVFGGVALLAGSIADRLRSARVQRVLNRTSAVIFVMLAAGALMG